MYFEVQVRWYIGILVYCQFGTYCCNEKIIILPTVWRVGHHLPISLLAELPIYHQTLFKFYFQHILTEPNQSIRKQQINTLKLPLIFDLMNISFEFKHSLLDLDQCLLYQMKYNIQFWLNQTKSSYFVFLPSNHIRIILAK